MKRYILVVGLFVIFSCGKEKQPAERPVDMGVVGESKPIDLNKEIIGTPPSVVSVTSSIDITFKESMVPDHFRGTVLDKTPFSFEPKINGYAIWISPTLLQFRPEDGLPAGEQVTGRLNGKILLGEQKNVNDFAFSFKVGEQEIISLEGDFEASKTVQNSVVYNGTLSFAQPVDIGEISRDLEFRSTSGRVKFNLESAGAEKVTITTSPIERMDKGQTFTLSLPAKYTVSKDKWKRELYLAGKHIFRVIAHMDMSDPEADQPEYGFRFSDPIQKDTDLSGYVTITPEINFNTKISNKYLLIRADFLPGAQYTINIAAGFPSVFGTKLSDIYTTTFFIDNIKPDLQWLSEGIYLPDGNAFKLQLKSVNVARARVEVYEIYPQNIGFFLQRNALVDESWNQEDRYYSFEFEDLSRVGERIHEKKIDITDKKNKWIKSELDLGPVFSGRRNSVFVVKLNFDMNDLTGKCVTDRNNIQEGDLYFEDDDYYSTPCSYGYYYSHGTLNKILISSDIALTIKKTENGAHVFATDVTSSKPINGLKLSLYNYQNKLLETKTTDGDGHVKFSKDGFYVYGQTSSGIAIMRLDHHEWLLNNFDVGGQSGGQSGVNAFMYTDRGVHRPGDTIHFSAIIRMSRKAPSPKQPVILTVKNPRGQIVHEDKTEAGENGHIYFPIQTDLADPTGNWIAELSVGGKTFTKTLKVETVKPNRLKILTDIPDKILPPNKNIAGTITSKYLFGAPAANLKANVRADFSGRVYTCDKFSSFTFTTPLKRFDPRSKTLFDGTLDQDGQYRLNYAVPSLNQAPALVNAVLHTTVYEKGGSFTQQDRSTVIYPYQTYVGVENVFKRSAATGEDYTIPIVVVDAMGQPVPDQKLQVSLYVNRKYWWWHYDDRDHRDFKEMKTTYRIGEFLLKSASKPVMQKITIEDQGQHYIEVTDLTSGHQAGFFFWASRWGAEQVQEKERSYLNIFSDKNVYNLGDKVTLSFDTPKDGSALFTLEQGGRLLMQEWYPVGGPQTTISFNVTEEMIPNCYASISLIQPHNQNTNDLPMRLYGIKTLYVEDQATRLPLLMEAPEALRPKQEFSIKITSSAFQKATCTIAVVDEGLLDLTDFKTPSPWEFFFKKIRLAVRTVDNFDEIIGTLFPDIDKYFSIGGDGFEEEREKRLDQSKVQRFVPVVLFQEPISIRPGETVVTKFTMPNYVGSVRIMMVGTSEHSYISLEKTVPVKQELMILPTIPRVARPGDLFAIPVSVFAMDSSIKNVKLSLEATPNIIIQGDKKKTLEFTKPEEKDTKFMVKVGKSIGADTINVVAASGEVKTDYTVHLPITSSNPFYTEVVDTMVNKNEKITLLPKKFGLEGTNKARIAFSRMPDIQLNKRLNDLIRYPYGCIEQTTSSIFPQLYLGDLQELSSYRKQQITDNINAGIARLQKFQMNGGFSFWPVSAVGQSHLSDWGTNYAGHFLVEAKELGYFIPPQLFNHWLEATRQAAKTVNTKNHRYQTYRLFLLALAGKPNIGAMNLVRENYLNTLDPLSKKLLAAAYYLSNEKNVAAEVDKSISTTIPDYREMAGTYGSSLRDLAFMAYLCIKMDDAKTAARVINEVNKKFTTSGWYSTQETAITLLALGSFYKKSTIPGGSAVFYLKMGDEKEEKITLSNYQMSVPLDDMWDKRIIVSSKNENPVFVTLFIEGIPLESRIKTENYGIELKRSFYDQDGHTMNVEEIVQGKPFWVIYKVASTYSQQLEELALTSVFPSGWEIINNRLTGTELPGWVQNHNLSSGEYMDIRDDRVNWFFDLDPNRSTTFGIQINPSFEGVYTLPPVSVEAMYSPEFFARIEGGTAQIK
ncbi:hypothetical protein JW935_26175 [candidate division KSB1 bacterium]|nr:hypothetical protein [candidate division KSB1 bacterium]